MRIDELKKEVIADMKQDAEIDAKSKIRKYLERIVSEQKKIAQCNVAIEEAKEHLRSVTIEETDDSFVVK